MIVAVIDAERLCHRGHGRALSGDPKMITLLATETSSDKALMVGPQCQADGTIDAIAAFYPSRSASQCNLRGVEAVGMSRPQRSRMWTPRRGRQQFDLLCHDKRPELGGKALHEVLVREEPGPSASAGRRRH